MINASRDRRSSFNGSMLRSRMAFIRTALFAVPIIAFTRCLPTPHALEGRPCEPDGRCPTNLVCVDGLCMSDPGPEDAGMSSPNLLANGDFENGLTQWSTSSTSTALALAPDGGRHGSAAVRVSYTPGADDWVDVSLSRTVFPQVTAGDSFCAEAFVSIGVLSSPVLLVLRQWAGTKFLDSSYEPVWPPAGHWGHARASIRVEPGYDQVNLRVASGAAAGVQFVVDDVRAWRSADGGCTDP